MKLNELLKILWRYEPIKVMGKDEIRTPKTIYAGSCRYSKNWEARRQMEVVGIKRQWDGKHYLTIVVEEATK